MGRFKTNAADAASVEGGTEMSDFKEAARDVGADVKETWRKADGEESLGDKLANAGDRLSNEVKNIGDDVHEGADDASRDAAYEKGRMDESR